MNARISLLIIISFCYSCKPKVESQFLGPNRNGYYPEKELLETWPDGGPKLLWQSDKMGIGHSSPAVTENAVLVTGLKDSVGYLFCLDLEGNLLWEEPYGEDWYVNYIGARSTPTIAGNLLYLTTGFGELICFHLKKRKKVWSRSLIADFSGDSLKYGRAESVLIEGDQLFCVPGGQENNVISLNRFTGDLIWSSRGVGDGATYSSPTLIRHNKHTILVAVTSNHLLGLDPVDGRLWWSVEHIQEGSVEHANTPVYSEGLIFMPSGSAIGMGGFTAIALSEDGSSARVLWKNSKCSNHLSGILVKDGCLFTCTHRRPNWLCLDAKTGDSLYSWSGYPYGNITGADDKFYVLSAEDGDVLLCEGSREGFSTISQFRLDLSFLNPWAPLWAFPVIKNKRLYIRHKEQLFVFDIAQSKLSL